MDVVRFDAADDGIPFDVWTTWPVDEVAHPSTAALGLLVLARFIDPLRRFYVTALIASVATDVDHIPLHLGLLGNEAQRPVTHSLSTVAADAHPSPGRSPNPDARIADGSVTDTALRGDLL